MHSPQSGGCRRTSLIVERFDLDPKLIVLRVYHIRFGDSEQRILCRQETIKMRLKRCLLLMQCIYITHISVSQSFDGNAPDKCDRRCATVQLSRSSKYLLCFGCACYLLTIWCWRNVRNRPGFRHTTTNQMSETVEEIPADRLLITVHLCTPNKLLSTPAK